MSKTLVTRNGTQEDFKRSVFVFGTLLQFFPPNFSRPVSFKNSIFTGSRQPPLFFLGLGALFYCSSFCSLYPPPQFNSVSHLPGKLNYFISTRHNDDEDLLVQLDVFEEQRLEDEEELSSPEGVNLTSHLDVFHALFKKVC